MDGMIAEFLAVAESILILVLLIAAGYASFVLGVLDVHATKRLSGFLINVTIPALIIASMQVPFSPMLLAGVGELLVLSAAFYAVSLAAAWLVPNLLRAATAGRGVVRFALVFANVGFMGFPVIETLYGAEALFFVAIFNLLFNALIFSLGIAMLTEERGEGFDPALLVNPGIGASIVGFLLFLFSVEIPSPLIDAIDLLGGTTTPLAMIIVGALLATFPAREMAGDWRIGAISAVRLLIIPAVLWLAVRPLGADPLITGIVVTLAAMPAAANTVIFAEEFGADARLASRIVFVSTVASMVTIPLVTTVLL